MNLQVIKGKAQDILDIIIAWAVSPQFYAQIAAIVIAIALAWFIYGALKSRIPLLKNEPKPGAFYRLRKKIFNEQDLLLPTLFVVFLGVAIP